jgi:hypothetical protein
MRMHQHCITVLILAAFTSASILQPLHGQEAESKTVKFFINNLPDKQPPTIRLISPFFPANDTFRTGTKEIDLIGEVTDQSGVRFVSVNSDIRNINEAGIFSSRLVLLPGYNQLRLVTSDELDNLAEIIYAVEYIPPVPTLADKISTTSKFYGLIIGIDDYRDPDLPDLQNPVNDARKLHDLLISKYSFNENEIVMLKDAKQNDIIDALDHLSNIVTPNDNVLIFYAGHGTWDERANVGYWLPSDAYLNSTGNWFRNSTLVDYLKTIHSRHTLLITDACFAGAIFNTRAGFQQEDRAYEILYELPSRKAMTSGTLSEVPDRSSFTRYLIDRLEKNENTYLSSEQLFSSFRIAVINNSDAIPQYGEIKNVGDEGGDFIFLKKR